MWTLFCPCGLSLCKDHYKEIMPLIFGEKIPIEVLHLQSHPFYSTEGWQMATMGQLYRLAAEYNTRTMVHSERQTPLPAEVTDRALSGMTGCWGGAQVLCLVSMPLQCATTEGCCPSRCSQGRCDDKDFGGSLKAYFCKHFLRRFVIPFTCHIEGG